jgi:formylglycine-generating enzyme required for sulfatase activity
VWEWCWDWYDRIEAGSETDPAGPPSGSFRVLRGGGWSLSAAGCAAAYRYIIDPGYSHVNLGFRVACP